jgi:hypothetical protein
MNYISLLLSLWTRALWCFLGYLKILYQLQQYLAPSDKTTITSDELQRTAEKVDVVNLEALSIQSHSHGRIKNNHKKLRNSLCRCPDSKQVPPDTMQTCHWLNHIFYYYLTKTGDPATPILSDFSFVFWLKDTRLLRRRFFFRAGQSRWPRCYYGPTHSAPGQYTGPVKTGLLAVSNGVCRGYLQPFRLTDERCRTHTHCSCLDFQVICPSFTMFLTSFDVKCVCSRNSLDTQHRVRIQLHDPVSVRSDKELRLASQSRATAR